MGIINKFKEVRSMLAKEIRSFNAGEITPSSKLPTIPNWFWQALLGVPRSVDFIQLRQYGKSPWVQMIKNSIKKQIMDVEWDVLNRDEEDDTDRQEEIKKIKTLLEQPNRNGQTFWELWGAFIDDVLDLDAGVMFKGRNGSGELVELFSYDGARFLTKIDEHGIKDGYYQYSFKHPASAPKFFEKEDIIYGMMGVNNDQYPYGWSPLQSIQQEVEVMIQSTRHNKEFFKNNAIPDGIVSVPMEAEAMERFKFSWEQNTKGKAHKLLFHNSDATFTPISMNNKDMEWLNGQKWYHKTIFAVFGLSGAEVGYHEDVNRSSQEGQERTTLRNAIKPYMKLIEDKINREIIPEIVQHDELMFKFFPKDDNAEKIEHDQRMAKLNANVITINEVRAMEGLEDVEWGDQPMAISMQERSEQAAANEEKGNNTQDDKKDNPKDKEKDKKEDKEEVKRSRELYNKLFTSFVKDDNIRHG